jgi:hypothetical protein
LWNPAVYISRSKPVRLLILASIRAVHNIQNPRTLRNFISLLTSESAASLWPQTASIYHGNLENVKATKHRMVANIWTTRKAGSDTQEWYTRIWHFDIVLCRSLNIYLFTLYLRTLSLVHTAYSRTVIMSLNNQMRRLRDTKW